MSISNTHRLRFRALLYLKEVNFPFSLRFFSNISDSRSFAASYLIHNFNFSPESASKLCSTYNIRFKTAEKANSVLSFFRNHGFSNSQLQNLIRKTPWLLSCNLYKRVLPKFDFFLSKGTSNSDIVNIISKHPYLLSPSMKNHIVPTYELLYRILQSDKHIIALLNYHQILFGDIRVAHNIRMLIENGMTDSSIARILRIRSKEFNTNKGEMLKVVEELKDLGFHPSKSTFSVALMAKLGVSRTQWNEKLMPLTSGGGGLMKIFYSGSI